MGRINIFFITLDSLRYDRLSFYGYSKRTSPFLHDLSLDSFVFRNFYANSIPTFFAFPTIFTGNPPFWMGNVLGIPRGSSFVNDLKKKGFHTQAFIAQNPLLYTNYNYDDGFDVFQNFEMDAVFSRWAKNKTLLATLKSFLRKRVFGRINEWMKNRIFTEKLIKTFFGTYCDGKKVIDAVINRVNILRESEKNFVWIHLMDTHYPYTNGFDYFKTTNSYSVSKLEVARSLCATRRYFNDMKAMLEKGKDLIQDIGFENLQMVKDLYDSSVRYVDALLERLIGFMNKQLDGRKVYIITSDHGDGFLEHYHLYHSPLSLYNELIRTPLLIYDTEVQTGKVVTGLFSHQDIKAMVNAVTNESLEEYVWKHGKSYIVSEIKMGMNMHAKVKRYGEDFGKYPAIYSVVFKNGIKIQKFPDERYEIYDIFNDPHETHSLKKNVGRYLKTFEDCIQRYLKSKLKLRIKCRCEKKPLLNLRNGFYKEEKAVV